MEITAEQVKDLREKTGVSVMQCRNALVEAEGDLEKALIILKKKSSGISMKKSDREAHEGVVVVAENENKAIMLVLNCETDFVARNSDFVELANNIAQKVLSTGVDFTTTQDCTDMIEGAIQKLGEKITVGKTEVIEGNTLGNYVHNMKACVIVSLEGGTKDLARDIAMHIAAMKPAFATSSEITDEDKVKVIEVFTKEVEESDKPADIKQKMLDGKIATYFKEQTLMDQSYIKNPDLTVEKLLSQNNAKFVKFIRESIG